MKSEPDSKGLVFWRTGLEIPEGAPLGSQVSDASRRRLSRGIESSLAWRRVEDSAPSVCFGRPGYYMRQRKSCRQGGKQKRVDRHTAFQDSIPKKVVQFFDFCVGRAALLQSNHQVLTALIIRATEPPRCMKCGLTRGMKWVVSRTIETPMNMM